MPGLALTPAGEPLSPDMPSLIVEAPDTTVEIDHSIVGAIQTVDLVEVKLANAIVDATAATRVAFSDPDGSSAGGVLTSNNSTIIGKVHTKRLDLASNTIFFGRSRSGGYRGSIR